jgi:D-alanyl-D-alanine carboxypeptidase
MKWIAKALVVLIVLFSTTITKTEAAKKPQIAKSRKYAAYVINAETGEVLFARSANLRRYPASLTKMMTLYLTFEAIENNKLNFNQKLIVSKRASRQPRGKLGLRHGEYITVKDAVNSLIVKSANDSALVLAEKIGGSQKQFAKLMNQKARQLGMTRTNFTNPHGLHNPNQVSTAADMARLGIALRKHFPKHYNLFSQTSFKFKGRTIYGHNNVMNRYSHADGLKTGFIQAAGYNLVTSARKPQGSLVAVVLGGPSAKMRDDHMIRILNYGYKRLEAKKTVVAKKGQKPGTRVAKVRKKTAVAKNNSAKHNAKRKQATTVAQNKKDVFTPVNSKTTNKKNVRRTKARTSKSIAAKKSTESVFSIVDAQKIAGNIERSTKSVQD